MKKILWILLILVLFPLTVNAKSYDVEDMTIKIDDSKWSVYTRNNINDKEKQEELEKLGTSSAAVSELMETNNIYLDAIQLDNNSIEIFVVIKAIENAKNFHKYSDEEIEKEIENIKDRVNNASISIKKMNNYKFLYSEYYDDKNKMNINEYYTVINGNSYRFFAQKKYVFTVDELEEMEKYANSITFRLDQEYEEKQEEKSTTKSIAKDALIKGVIAAVVVGISGAIVSKLNKNK